MSKENDYIIKGIIDTYYWHVAPEECSREEIRH